MSKRSRSKTPPPPAPTPTPGPSPELSGRRRLVFTGLMLALPVLFFALLEGGLRLVGYGDAYPLFVPVPGAPGYLVQSDDVARRYFAQQAQVPNSIGDQFRAEKADGALRVFVQGGSSAAGFPFYHGGAFSRVLQQRLQQTLPGREVEVVNTAMAAVGSYTLRDLADEIVAHAPDAVLLYAGHNEYYGALGVGSTESLGRVPWVVNAYLGLRGFRTVQLLRGALSGAMGLVGGAPAAGERPSNTLMGQMVGEQTIPYGSEVYRAGLRQFRTNLSAILATYADAGVPVFVGTLASNERDQRPFVTVHALADRAAWQARVRAGADAFGRGDLDAAEAAFRAAVALDSLAADAYYGLGRVLERAGRAEAAREAYLAAKDRDALRFRAPEAFNAVVREEAARHGATVVDVQGALRARAPGGAIGREHMLEHLHPTLDGYFVLADAFYDALLESPVVGDEARPVPEEAAYAGRLVTAIDSLVGVLRVRRLMSEWPFQPLGTRLQLDTLTGRSPVDQMAWQLYRGETDWLSAAEWLADHYAQRGELERALRVHLAVAQELPSRAEPRTAAGNVLMAMGQPAEAAPLFEAALARDPDAAPALGMLGAIRLSGGERAEAVRLLERAHRLAPTNTQFLYNLAGAYALTDRIEDARRAAQEVLRLDPDHTSARMLLQSLPPA
ncbi:MAG: tetratricopeptide repeat protein [Rubricoccaceae bacterium]|nr:tetratricopeptide repeat protein [Rubricoccaceae bacterium]